MKSLFSIPLLSKKVTFFCSALCWVLVASACQPGVPSSTPILVFPDLEVVPAPTPTPIHSMLNLVEAIGGSTSALAVQGSYAYMSQGSNLVVIDISDPTNPVWVGEAETQLAYEAIWDILVSGTSLYLAAGDAGLRVFDISVPTRPALIGSYDSHAVRTMAVDESNSCAYVNAGNWVDGILRIIDISDPYYPAEIAHWDSGLSTLQDIAYLESTLFIIGPSGTLLALDVSDAIDPTPLTSLDLSSLDPPLVFSYGLTIRGSYAFVTGDLASLDAEGNAITRPGDPSGMWIIDISEPNSPLEVVSIETGGYPTAIVTGGDFAYVAWGTDVSLEIIDISDPTQPYQVGSHVLRRFGSEFDLVVMAEYVYVADPATGLRIIDVSEPSLPKEVGSYPLLTYIADVAAQGEIIYALSGSGLWILDISTPSEPAQIGHHYVADWRPTALAVKGNYVYAAEITDAAGEPKLGGVRIIDVSDLTRPFGVGTYETMWASQRLIVSDNHLYAALEDGSVEIIDISQPVAPHTVGHYVPREDLSPTDFGIAASENYLYVAGDWAGLKIVDIINPANPIEVAAYIECAPDDVAIGEDVIYLACRNIDRNDGTLHIMDVSNPVTPTLIEDHATEAKLTEVAVYGRFVVFAGHEWPNYRLSVIDVSDPSSPEETAYHILDCQPARLVFTNTSYPYVYTVCSGRMIIFHLWADPGPITTPTETVSEALTQEPMETAIIEPTPTSTFTIQPTVTPVLADAPPADAVLGDAWTRPADDAVMVYVPAGEFEMGSTEGYDTQQPVHTVSLDGFWLDQTEVTNAQFATFLNEEGNQTEGGWTWLDLEKGDSEYVGCLIEQSGGGEFQPRDGYANHPATQVSWYGAAAYCKWAGGRLPTEAEWEYAARGPEGNIYPWGDDAPTCDLAQYIRCREYTVPVGSFPSGASWCHALNMAGNVSEWVTDWYSDYHSGTQANPTGPATGEYRVLRGGSWLSNLPDSMIIRSTNRNKARPGSTTDFWGFRCIWDT